MTVLSKNRVVKSGCRFLLWLLCAVALAVTGCRTTDASAPGQTASVLIRGNTPGQVSDMAVAVFESHGYQLASQRVGTMVFEKRGSTMSKVAYGNWMDSDVWVRVRAEVVPVGEGTVRLQCLARLIRDKGGATEEEIKSLRRSPYQDLLDEVAARFK